MKRLIACIIIFSIQIELISQNIGCELIFESIQSEVFQKEFSICKDTLSFTIYDKTNKIVTCRNIELCNKTLKISNDSCYKDITFEKKTP